MKKTANLRTKENIEKILGVLPPLIKGEIRRMSTVREDFTDFLSEIRLRVYGRSSLVLSGENIPLSASVKPKEIEDIFDKITGGSIHAHTFDTREGFVSMDGGIRVGIFGDVSGDGTFIKRINGMVFRIPSAGCENIDTISAAWDASVNKGMLLYSLPGEGKTTAIRALAGYIGCTLMKRVCVIDERREFNLHDYAGGMVDILSGYSKSKGLEIALRTLNPEFIIVDEIGNAEESDSLIAIGRGGVPIIATTHAKDLDEACSKAAVMPLVKENYFSLFVRLFRNGRKIDCEIHSVDHHEHKELCRVL